MFSRYIVFIGLALIAVALCADSVNANKEERTAKCRELVKAHVDLKAKHLLLEEAVALCEIVCLKEEECVEEDSVDCVKNKLTSTNL